MTKRQTGVLIVVGVPTLLVLGFLLARQDPNSRVCPQCGRSDRTVPIVYGKPGPDLINDARQGKCVLAGCMVKADSPKWNCQECGESWGTAAEAREASARWWEFWRR